MSWHCYELTYRIETPLHIGYRHSGYIQHTRYYVPGRVLWGAATAVLTRQLYNEAEAKHYGCVGDFLKEHCIFSYFYPAVNQFIYRPEYSRKHGLIYQHDEKIYESEMGSRFIHAVTATSIRGSTQSAENESLHEMEFINTHVKTGTHKIKSVQIKGHLFVNEDARSLRIKDQLISELLSELSSEEIIKKYFAQLVLGGESAYGYGKVRLEQCKPTKEIFGWKLDRETSTSESKLMLSASSCTAYLPAHSVFNEEKSHDYQFYGDRELYQYRSWSGDIKTGGIGAGRSIDTEGLCWVPGTRLEYSEREKAPRFAISNYGVWVLE